MPKSESFCPRLVSEEEVLLQAERLKHLAPTVAWEVDPKGKGHRLMSIDQVIRRFWERVDASKDCWIWKESTTPKGYGVLEFRRTRILAHRLSFILHHGLIPLGLFVLHRCDNPPCVNPAHLFLGTVKDNSVDMVEKGRSMIGSRHHNAKLSESQVLQIVKRYKNQISGKNIAGEFGVSETTVSQIVTGHRWAWLTKITP